MTLVVCQQHVQLLLRRTKCSGRTSIPSCAVHTSAGKSQGEHWQRDPSTPLDVIQLCCCSELLLGQFYRQCYSKGISSANGLAWLVLHTSGEWLCDLGCAGSDSKAGSVQHWLCGWRTGYSGCSTAAP